MSQKTICIALQGIITRTERDIWQSNSLSEGNAYKRAPTGGNSLWNEAAD